MLSPRGYGIAYGFEIFSHRVLRYASPFLHLIALAANLALLGEGTRLLGHSRSPARPAGRRGAVEALVPLRPLRLARYYVLVTASIAAGLWDRIRLGTPGSWTRAEGTR